MTASLVIPTHNRRATLERLLALVLGEAAADTEVIVVDNGSTDGTAALLDAAARRSTGRLRVVHEPVAGATRARNAGAHAARGTLVAFLDDDARPRPGWLAALLAPFADPAVGCTGGRVVLAFGDGERPAWLTETLAAYLAAYDLGPGPLDLAGRARHEAPRALNMAVRRDALLAAGGFSPALGPRAARPSVGEESELCVRLLARGHGVRYVPAATVEHVIHPARLEARWFLRRAFWTGWAEGVIDVRHARARRIAGRVRWHYGAHALRRPPRAHGPGAALTARCAQREAWGYLLAVVRHLPAPGRVARAGEVA